MGNRFETHGARTTHEGRYWVLVLALASMFVVFPFLSDYFLLRRLVNVFMTIILLSAAFAVLRNHRVRILVGTLVALTLCARWVQYMVDVRGLALVKHGIEAVVLSLATSVILAHVLQKGKVTFDKINGAIAVYLLMGLIWAGIYVLLERLQPGSFSLGPGDGSTEGRDLLADFFYYSFITLSTLGYGDITPLSRAARSLAALEAIAGQLYLTVLVARLVGLHIAHSSGSD